MRKLVVTSPSASALHALTTRAVTQWHETTRETPVLGRPVTPAGSGLHYTEGALEVAQRLAGLAPLPALGVQRNEEHAIPERRRRHQPVRLQLPGHRQGTGLIDSLGLCIKARGELSIGHGPETGLVGRVRLHVRSMSTKHMAWPRNRAYGQGRLACKVKQKLNRQCMSRHVAAKLKRP